MLTIENAFRLEISVVPVTVREFRGVSLNTFDSMEDLENINSFVLCEDLDSILSLVISVYFIAILVIGRFVTSDLDFFFRKTFVFTGLTFSKKSVCNEE